MAWLLTIIINQNKMTDKEKILEHLRDPEGDSVSSPQEWVDKILGNLDMSGSYLDPAKGDGAFYDSVTLEDKSYCEIEEGIDFFEHTDNYDWIATLAPWSNYEDWLTHGMKRATNVVYVTTDVHHNETIDLINDNGYGVKEIMILKESFITTPNIEKTPINAIAVHLKKDYEGETTTVNL